MQLNLRPLGRCIYCGKTDVELSKEHVIPYALGGRWTLKSASCKECADKTSLDDLAVCRGMYLPLRAKQKWSSRHSGSWPTCFPVVLVRADGSREAVELPIDQYPTVYPVVKLPPPGALIGAPLSDRSPELQVTLVGDTKQIEALGALYPDTVGFETPHRIHWGALCRVLAKIAHSYLVGRLGVAGYTPLLPGLILGDYPYLSHLVGGSSDAAPERKERGRDGLSIALHRDAGYIVVAIDIMGGRLPQYWVVAGRIEGWGPLMNAFNAAGHRDERWRARHPGLASRFAFTHEWVGDVVYSLKNVMSTAAPVLAKHWPMPSGFEFDVYGLPPSYYLFVVREVSRINPSGPSLPVRLPYSDHPAIPPTLDELASWNTWTRTHFRLRPEDMWFLLPVRDSGKHMGTRDDFALFADSEKAFWEGQWQFLIAGRMAVAASRLNASAADLSRASRTSDRNFGQG